jgi:uncharacterized protein YcbX
LTARIARISIAPVKALGLVHPDEVELGELGVAGNRRFWLLEHDGRLVSNKRHRTLLQVRPEWDEETRVLTLVFPDGTRVEGTVDLGDDVFEQPMHGYGVKSRAVHGPWADALSDYAGRRLTMLWAVEGAPDRLYAGTATLVSRESVQRLAEVAGEESLDARRFRMTFDIEGVEAHEEDQWIGAEVRIGDATIRIHGDVGRCAITTLDPDTGEPTVDTLKALASYRKDGVKEPLPLGVHASVVVPGRVRVGDPVQALIANALY